MSPADLTLDAIKHLRGELGDLRAEVRAEIANVRGEIGELRTAMRSEVSGVRGEIGALREEVRTLVRQSELRVATEIVAVAGAVREMRDMLRDSIAVRAQVDDHERRILGLERGG